MTLPSRGLRNAAGLRAALGATLASALLVACGGGETKDKPASQVAAKVNKEEISVHQINFMLQRQSNLKPEQVEPASRVALDRLIDQELTVQKAIEQKIDRDPRVLQALDAARREILARAYIDRLSAAITPPSEDEIRAYYAKQPALFSQRRVYQLQEFMVEGPGDALKALQEKVAGSKDGKQLAQLLRDSGLKVGASQAVRSAEQIPLGLLDRFAALRDGDTLTHLGPSSLQVIHLASSRSAPVDEAQARTAIERFLLNDRKRELVAKDLKALREAAQIDYLGKFADMKQLRPSGGPEAASAPSLDLPTAPDASTPVPSVPAAASAAASALGSEALNRGVRGLK